jgi:hypothetical protein
MRFIIALVLLLPSCQSLRDSMQAARINQNLDDTDRMLEHYANKAK